MVRPPYYDPHIPKPVGLLSFADDRAALICSICLQAGISVPEEVAILGIGNIHAECELAPVPLSSIDTALTRRGQAVVRLLQGLMKGGPPPKHPILVPPTRVVVRSSTDVLAVKDQNVAKAMRYMWGHLSENISVDSIADAVEVNRRKLERAFRIHLKRSISAELRRKRLERCREMLRETDLTVTDIAAAIGFTSADYLHASFKKAFGITPTEYRKKLRS